MKIRFHPDAMMEFDAAAMYYEERQQGLGLEFAEEVYATIARILDYPDAWPPLSQNTRRCLTTRFPYGIVYQIKSDVLRIIAVANLHRRPGYWKGRVE
jgi:hypothetical protein